MFELIYIACFLGSKDMCVAAANGFTDSAKSCITKALTHKDDFMKANHGWVVVAFDCYDLTDMVKGQHENPPKLLTPARD